MPHFFAASLAARRRSSLYGAVRRKEKRPFAISNSMQPVSGSASVWRQRRLDPALSWRERNWNTSDFVLENVGEGTSALRISFRSPESFGFDMERFNAQPVTAICAHSGPPDWDIPRTTFIHFARAVEDGIELRTRFWLGWMIVNKQPVRTDFAVDPWRVQGLSRHSPQEYYRLAKYLPQIFAENHDKPDRAEDLTVMDFAG